MREMLGLFELLEQKAGKQRELIRELIKLAGYYYVTAATAAAEEANY